MHCFWCWCWHSSSGLLVNVSSRYDTPAASLLKGLLLLLSLMHRRNRQQQQLLLPLLQGSPSIRRDSCCCRCCCIGFCLWLSANILHSLLLLLLCQVLSCISCSCCRCSCCGKSLHDVCSLLLLLLLLRRWLQRGARQVLWLHPGGDQVVGCLAGCPAAALALAWGAGGSCRGVKGLRQWQQRPRPPLLLLLLWVRLLLQLDWRFGRRDSGGSSVGSCGQ
jgi:hypothetical protein